LGEVTFSRWGGFMGAAAAYPITTEHILCIILRSVLQAFIVFAGIACVHGCWSSFFPSFVLFSTHWAGKMIYDEWEKMLDV
jgi:hypothetical protein